MSCTHDCNQGRTCTCICTDRHSDPDAYDTWEAIFNRLAIGLALMACGATVALVVLAKMYQW